MYTLFRGISGHQSAYLDHEENTADVAVLSVVYPLKEGDTYPIGQQEKTTEDIRAFLWENDYRSNIDGPQRENIR